MARFLEALAGTPVTWLLTARRCLLSGVAVFPVIAPLVHSRRNAFPRVRALTSLLRWNPLALDIADALVGSRRGHRRGAARLAASTSGVEPRARHGPRGRRRRGAACCVDWAWARLPPAARRTADRCWRIARAITWTRPRWRRWRARAPARAPALNHLRRWAWCKSRLPDRFALHAVVRYALAQQGQPARRALLRLLRAPARAAPGAVRHRAVAPLRRDGPRAGDLVAGQDAAGRGAGRRCLKPATRPDARATDRAPRTAGRGRRPCARRRRRRSRGTWRADRGNRRRAARSRCAPCRRGRCS